MKYKLVQKYYSHERVMLLDVSFMYEMGWEVISQELDKHTGNYRVVYEKR